MTATRNSVWVNYRLFKTNEAGGGVTDSSRPSRLGDIGRLFFIVRCDRALTLAADAGYILLPKPPNITTVCLVLLSPVPLLAFHTAVEAAVAFATTFGRAQYFTSWPIARKMLAADSLAHRTTMCYGLPVVSRRGTRITVQRSDLCHVCRLVLGSCHYSSSPHKQEIGTYQ